MKKKCFLLIVLAVSLEMGQPVSAQYPKIPNDIKEQSDALMKETYRRSDSAWQVAWPAVDNDARHGKPYIPWAARPTDLPQSSILAFPGAEGGGAHSFGGHGGRVLVVT